MDNRFIDIIQIIRQSRSNALRKVNAELINLYWNIGEYICMKLSTTEWGDSVVTELAKYILQNEPFGAVEYALSRSLSPTMVSEYKTQLPDKKLLQKKLHELFDKEINE